MEAEKIIASLRQSVSATGGGEDTPELTPPETKISSVRVCGIVSEEEGDTDERAQLLFNIF